MNVEVHQALDVVQGFEVQSAAPGRPFLSPHACGLFRHFQGGQGDKAGAMQATFLKSWVLVDEPGTDEQEIVGEYNTFSEALRAQQYSNKGRCSGMELCQVMKRGEHGELTTEF